jgi:RNA polymerase sigma-70 factor (ECF subfamily)
MASPIRRSEPPEPPRSPEGSFERCYARHRASVFRWALRFGAGDVAWAEDLAHDVFLEVLRCMGRLDDMEGLGSWLYRVTAHMAYERLRRERSVWRRVLTRYGAGKERTAPPADVPWQRQETSRRALEAVASLPPLERMVLTMKLLDGKSQKEIAWALELSEGYVSKLAARAIARIRKGRWEVDDAP